MKEASEYTDRQIALTKLQRHISNTLKDKRVWTSFTRAHKKVYPKQDRQLGFWHAIFTIVFLLILFTGIGGFLIDFNPVFLLIVLAGSPVFFLVHQIDTEGSIDYQESLKTDPSFSKFVSFQHTGQDYPFSLFQLNELCDEAVIYGQIGPAMHDLLEAFHARIMANEPYLLYADRARYVGLVNKYLDQAAIWPVLNQGEQVKFVNDVQDLIGELKTGIKKDATAHETTTELAQSSSKSQTQSR